jgi:hypothetical protein
MSYSSTQNLDPVYNSVTVKEGIVSPDPVEATNSDVIGYFDNTTFVTVNLTF